MVHRHSPDGHEHLTATQRADYSAWVCWLQAMSEAAQQQFFELLAPDEEIAGLTVGQRAVLICLQDPAEAYAALDLTKEAVHA